MYFLFLLGRGGNENPAHDEGDANKADDTEGFLQHEPPEDGGGNRTQSAEHGRTFGGGIALRNRLQGEAEAAANKGKCQNQTPFGCAGGQARRFKKKGGDAGEKSHKANLQNTQHKGIALSGQAVGQDNSNGIENSRQKCEQCAALQGKGNAAAQGQQKNAEHGKGEGENSRQTWETPMQDTLKNGYKDDCRIFQKGNGRGGRGLQGGKFCCQYREKRKTQKHPLAKRM